MSILRTVECQHDTPALTRISNHHEIVKKAVHLINTEDTTSGGALGKKTSVKYRVYMRLDRFCKENDGTLWVTVELKKAIDDIYKHPLKEFARDSIGRQLKAGISDEALANLVVSLRDDDKLCITEDDQTESKQPQIICSMGMKNGDK